MFKEGQPSSERASESEQFGFSQEKIDQLYEEAFRGEAVGISSEIGYNMPKILGVLLDQAGYRLEDSDGAILKASQRFPINAVFLKKGESEDGGVMIADFGLDFSMDEQAGTLIFTLEPLRAEPGHPRQQDANEAMYQVPRSLTLIASAERRAEMKKIKEEREREREEGRVAQKRFFDFAEAHQDRDLTPKDYAKHRSELGPLPVVDKGIWRLEKKGLRWVFSWFDGSMLLDVIEFGDAE